jgi:hypothetical protein
VSGSDVSSITHAPGLHGEDLLLADGAVILNAKFNEHAFDPPDENILPVQGRFAQKTYGKDHLTSRGEASQSCTRRLYASQGKAHPHGLLADGGSAFGLLSGRDGAQR